MASAQRGDVVWAEDPLMIGEDLFIECDGLDGTPAGHIPVCQSMTGIHGIRVINAQYSLMSIEYLLVQKHGVLCTPSSFVRIREILVAGQCARIIGTISHEI